MFVNVVVSDTVGQNNARFSMPSILEVFKASQPSQLESDQYQYQSTEIMCLCAYATPIDLYCYQRKKLPMQSTYSQGRNYSASEDSFSYYN